jgi:hypothetical protein
MTEKITFKARDKDGFELQPRPIPASAMLPDWWNNFTPFEVTANNPDGKKLSFSQIGTSIYGITKRSPNLTPKKCGPMLEALTTGYIVTLWADVFVQYENNKPQIYSKTNRPVFLPHGPLASQLEPPFGYTNKVFKYMNTWIPQTPKGYSIMITQPFGHINSPLYTIPAVIDTDVSFMELLPPMWLRGGFEGIIKKGTPLFMFVPFKRSNWKAEFEYYENGEYELVEEKKFNTNIVNHYSRFIRQPKTYK